MIWKQLLRRLSVRRRHQEVLHLPTDILEDVRGLPGDSPSNVPHVLSVISCIMDKIGVRWCIVGDLLLAYYAVPKVTGVITKDYSFFGLNTDGSNQDIEVCVPLENLRQTQEAFSTEVEFCAPFRPGRSYYNKHLAQFPRFRVKGMNQCFFLVPDSHYGLDSMSFADIMRPSLDFPLLPLPHYVNGLASAELRPDTDHVSFLCQIEYLIDGMDIDEEWCRIYLDGPGQDLVRSRSSRSAKKARMGSHPKYEGNLTTHIRNVEERNSIINIVGRVMENRTLHSSPSLDIVPEP